MGNNYRIKVTGKPKEIINLDLLAQAIIAMTEHELVRQSDVSDDDYHEGKE